MTLPFRAEVVPQNYLAGSDTFALRVAQPSKEISGSPLHTSLLRCRAFALAFCLTFVTNSRRLACQIALRRVGAPPVLALLKLGQMSSTQDYKGITPLRFRLRPVGFHKGGHSLFHFFEISLMIWWALRQQGL
jgi:hypothetical protein